MTQDEQKKIAGQAAIELIEDETIIGVGTGSTVNYFIEALATIRHKIEGAVPSSVASEKLLKEYNIPILDLNNVFPLPIYIDGADEIDSHGQMIKGGGGALTREKIVAACAQKMICIADQSKKVEVLGKFPLPIEVIPCARSYVARETVKLGGRPQYREGFITDNGNVILDIWGLKILQPKELETTINDIAGVVTNGIFALRPADTLLLGTEKGVITSP